MGWILFKIADFLIKASNVMLLLAVVGVVLALITRRRWPLWVGALGLGGLVVLSVIPIGEWMIVPLENRFPLPVRYPERVDGVVAISDRLNAAIIRTRGTFFATFAERPLALIELGRRFPNAKLVITGLGESTSSYPARNAAAMREIYARLGFDAERIIYEETARNPHEFAGATHELARPQPGERWLLVTSAAEMPRAMGTFRKAGWDGIEAWPVDYVTTGEYDPIAPHVRLTYYPWLVDWATVEWLGMATYYWRGWIDELFPGPAPAPAQVPAPSPTPAVVASPT
jgi:uncharacterized SAM-binding protein YcdF (DUF218 family)